MQTMDEASKVCDADSGAGFAVGGGHMTSSKTGYGNGPGNGVENRKGQ